MQKRLVNSEFNQVKRFATFISELNYLKEELASHWKMVKDGENRIQKLTDESLQLFDELLDTIPKNQIKSPRNAMTDYKVVFAPILSPESKNVVLNKEDAKALIDLAQAECKYCVKTPEEAEDCPIFKLTNGIVPPNTYDSLICVYSTAEWKD